MGFGWTEILLISLVVLLIFGPERLPELARGIGQSVSELKKGMQDVKGEIEEPAKTLEEEATGWSRDSNPASAEKETSSNGTKTSDT